MSAREERNPALLTEYDPAWSARPARHLADIREVLSGLVGVDLATFDHIGSISVIGLAAKPYIDLQVRILPLPGHRDLTASLGPWVSNERTEPVPTHPVCTVTAHAATKSWPARFGRSGRT